MRQPASSRWIWGLDADVHGREGDPAQRQCGTRQRAAPRLPSGVGTAGVLLLVAVVGMPASATPAPTPAHAARSPTPAHAAHSPTPAHAARSPTPAHAA